mmetsp:Transcript_66536/g.192101  ORF Transcript_66536/g.192101 Transcript_66536/m.192101 type:complete len:628 (-) Transcript_66536:281-2164(-)
MALLAFRAFLWAQAPRLFLAAGAEGTCSEGSEDAAMFQMRVTEHIPASALPQGPGGMPSEAQLARAKARALAKEPEELREPEVLQRPFKLKLQQTWLATEWIGGGFWTRAYGSIPGPTIKVKPGEVLEIEFENDLGPGPGFDSCDVQLASLGNAMNPSLICALNTSSLHTHGLHVSGEGIGDNVLRFARPGETLKYEIPVPKNHMGGTHWYHPHVHHSTASQAGGGAHGALIVEDPEDYLPKEVADMPEKMFFLSLVNLAKMMRLESWGLLKTKSERVEQVLWKNPEYPFWKWSEANDDDEAIPPQLVVNGQYLPKMTLDESKWYRLRMTFAAIEQRAEIYLVDGGKGGASCEFQLLATDGIYLHNAPRPIERIHLASGSRADVAVQCSCSWWVKGSKCGAQVMFQALWQPIGAMGMVSTMADTTDQLMTLEITRSDSPPASVPSIAPFSVRRPCYLADLRRAWVDRRNRHDLNLPMIFPLQVEFDGHGEVWGAHGKLPPPLADLPVGEIQEWQIKGAKFHPFHIHVNPFQITTINNDGYYMPGDWHDTFLPTGTDVATVRMNIDAFTGKMIAHCHILEHEDNGMMAWFNIIGEDGSTYKKAKTLDPTCYEEEYPGPVPPPPKPQWR